jgi:RNA polymerase sigma-70 factor (ECF subfamily)
MHNTITFGHQISMTSSVATEPADAKHLQTEERVTPEMQAQERAWALAAQQGDSSAFMHIVDAYQRPVYNLCYRMLGDVSEAEDAAQETFLRAYTKLDTYQSNRKFSSWLLSIASHYCIDRLRKRRYQIVSWDDLPPWRWLPDTEPQPEEVTLAHESDDTLYALLDTLPSDYRAATLLRYWYEMSYDEIAETLNTSVSAIKSRLFRARQMLAKAAQQAEVSALAIP